MTDNGKTHWAECWIDHDECLVDGLRSAAQNDYMIDQNYLPTGSLLLRAADRIAELEAERDDALELMRAAILRNQALESNSYTRTVEIERDRLRAALIDAPEPGEPRAYQRWYFANVLPELPLLRRR
jgi:hypothetical protein